MITSIKKISLAFSFMLLLITAMSGCMKDENAETLNPGEYALFLPAASSANYSILTPTTIYKIPVGLTQPLTSGKTRTVNIVATSTTGAVEGTHYTYTKTLNFAPGKITDTIVVTGAFSQYSSGRRDTVRFAFADAADASPTLNSRFTLNIAQCLESDVVFANMSGNYTQTYEDGSYGPYTSTITGVTRVNTTSSTATITNLYDSGIEALAKFDYSTPGSFSVTIDPQATGFVQTSTGLPISVRTTPGTTSFFTYCTPTFTIYIDLFTSAGLMARWEMTMAR
ncbi:hypothetical protein LZZ85_09225 [Terrimonas sp. NA20]|uniref:DUF1735 domain-containing protein n=1 Tax=Terrimonas ginsenosidimutans TaxID=2908004 RepID=A0ABS9KQ81_9BACT|nr:hypothetical protein [Terrimonas ginsenosidimutans]MCG2614461.1 hypothetical protein [Terrimonas ginsenosidimutans]